MKITTMTVGGVLGTNCYIIQDDDLNCALVDPGADAQRILEYIKDNKLAPKAVLFTHGHYDHIGGLYGLCKKYPDIEIYISHKDITVVESMRDYLENPECADIIMDRSKDVKDGDVIKVGTLEFTVIETPGHTIGGVIYTCGNAMFSGDTLFHREIGRCDLYTGDYDTMMKTLRKLAEIKRDYVVYPGHEMKTTLGEEKKHNRYIKAALFQ